MNWKGFFKRRGYSWRVQHYIDTLEQHHEDLPDAYDREQEAFQSAFRRFLRDRSLYLIASMLFYASLVTSVTASIGFRINVFEQLYGVLGFSTVVLLYLLTQYNMRLSRADFENARTRIIAVLTAHEHETVPAGDRDATS